MVNPIQCNRQKTTKGLITMFEEIIASKEVKFNDLEKKVFKFVCFFLMFNNKINVRSVR